MFIVSLSEFFITSVRNDLHWEILYELSEVTSDVRHRYVQRSLEFDKPVSIRDLVGWEQILRLGHLSKGIS